LQISSSKSQNRTTLTPKDYVAKRASLLLRPSTLTMGK
jgi:hypothetical protein